MFVNQSCRLSLIFNFGHNNKASTYLHSFQQTGSRKLRKLNGYTLHTYVIKNHGLWFNVQFSKSGKIF